MADLRNYNDIPRDVKNFLSYLSNIKGKSDTTINEYYYDLRTFFRFMKCHRLIESYDDFEKIDCSDIDTDFIKSITLEKCEKMAHKWQKVFCNYGMTITNIERYKSI